MAHLKQNTLCCKISIKVSTCNNISILASIHINKYFFYYMNVYSFNYSIVTFFSESWNRGII